MVSHAAVGNINLDIYVVVDHLPGPDEDSTAYELYIGPGGAAANYAVAAARMGHDAILVGHLGTAGLGAILLDMLRRNGVRTEYVIIHHDKEPGIVVVLVSRGGERAMATMRGANTLLRGDEATLSVDVLHIASREPDIVKRAVNSIKASYVSYDPGGRIARQYGGRLLDEIRDRVNLVAVNKVEAQLVFGSADPVSLVEFIGGKLGYILLKRGSKGAILVTRNGYYIVEAYREATVLDTTGAGDVFIAVFNAYLSEGADIPTALRAASIAAGIKIGRRGAQSAPTREEVETRLKERGPNVSFREL